MEIITKKSQYDVIVIGGGITGAGTARDCAMRGLRTLLVERLDLTNGATGRNHGLLHSGARYAVTDGESATECIKENMILRRIARHCVEQTDGLFVTLPEDDLGFQNTFIEACTRAGIRAEAIDPAEARRLEPSVNPSLIGAVRVPDGSVDPFRLTTANALDARLHGAEVMTYHEVVGFIKDGRRVVGVRLRNRYTKAESEAYASITVNAGGIWGHRIAEMAGAVVNMFPAKGALLIFGHRVNNMVLNRCRKPADADILVPGDTISLIGTTSSRVPYDEIDDLQVTPDEVNLLLREGQKLAPSLAQTRILRAYSGVRPLVAADNDVSGRSISRGIVCLDHETRDDIPGFITITGGKLMTYRLMAEWATDLVCKKLNIDKQCQTAEVCLPGSAYDEEQPSDKETITPIPSIGTRAAEGRHGSMSKKISADNRYDRSLVCECEAVSIGEVDYAIKQLRVQNLINLRRRTRVGMGTCQGELCACRAAGLLGKANGCAQKAQKDLAMFLNERWRGMYPVAWGDTLCETQFTSWVYEGVCGLDKFAEE
ncbi:MAG: anaerobic glycerol-3-phosphate dehydrogenase subunit A [Rikenellaceae bacterium]|nr:anaerobic glycerol-3-phosphate dehydrogenase subunit A [Rikenellaceae bacterium]